MSSCVLEEALVMTRKGWCGDDGYSDGYGDGYGDGYTHPKQ
jgi:hypothetical protein